MTTLEKSMALVHDWIEIAISWLFILFTRRYVQVDVVHVDDTPVFWNVLYDTTVLTPHMRENFRSSRVVQEGAMFQIYAMGLEIAAGIVQARRLPRTVAIVVMPDGKKIYARPKREDR